MTNVVEVGRLVKREHNKMFKGFKISARTRNYEVLNITIYVKPDEILSLEELYEGRTASAVAHLLAGNHDNWLSLSGDDLVNFVEWKYSKLIESDTLSEKILKPSAIERMTKAKEIVNQNNYDNSDVYTDYFDRGIYDFYEYRLA